MFNDKTIISVISCRGTDRTMPPPTHVHAEEAPFRKTLMILRPSGQVAYEANWEKWNQLSHRQLIRPAHACKLNITMFAQERAVQPRSTDVDQPEPASASSSQSHAQPDMSRHRTTAQCLRHQLMKFSQPMTRKHVIPKKSPTVARCLHKQCDSGHYQNGNKTN